MKPSGPPRTRYNRDVDSPAAYEQAAPPPSDRRQAERRLWRLVAAVALLVGILAGGGAGLLVMQTIRARYGAVVSFSPNLSVFSTIPDVPQLLPKVLPAVVAIRAVRTCGTASGPGAEQVAGSGMILTAGGDVLTNDHVVAHASSITVTVPGQAAPLRAVLLGADASEDVALLRVVGARRFPTVHFGRSAGVEVGDPVLAIGDALALSNTEPSVTEGIISATGRAVQAGGHCETSEKLTGLLQTQAAINSGNSGGPLVTGDGLVIGMSTATGASTPGNPRAQDIGFAIPIDTIEALLPGLEHPPAVHTAALRVPPQPARTAPSTTGTAA